MEEWAEPVIRWHPRTDSLARQRPFGDAAQLLARWPAAPSESSPTDCLKSGADFWLWQPGTGGLSFRADSPVVDAYPALEVDLAWFENVVFRNWLPAVYQAWGRQVLHASAAVARATGDVIVFTGPSGAGKSTLAFSLAQRPGWAQVADDTLAFAARTGAITLHPLRNEARLRAATAEHHGRTGLAPAEIPWPGSVRAPRCVYVLSGTEHADLPATIERLKPAASYPLLLEQAHAFTLAVAAFNQQLMRDYLAFAAAVPAYRLVYRRSFADLDRVLDAIALEFSQHAPHSRNE